MNNRVSFLFSLYLIGRRVRGEYKHQSEDGMLQATVLHLLSNQNLTITQLANRLSTKVSAISEKIIEMEKDKLVTKAKKEDGRESIVCLSEQGKEQMRKAVHVMKEHCVEITNKLSEKELQVLVPILDKITR